MLAETFDRIGKVEINTAPAGAHPAAVVALLLGGAGGDVARGKVAEARIFPLQVIIALYLRYLIGGRLMSSFFFGTQQRPSFLSDSDIRVSLDW